MRSELPALLDLLRVSVEAGSSLPKALRDVGARTRGPLAAEWRALGREVALGVPLEAALRSTVERLPIPEVRSLVAALERARRHGAPLADTLASQARDARFALARHAREDAARAGPKIQLVVALLLVPSVLLLVAAALVAALLDGGGAALAGVGAAPQRPKPPGPGAVAPRTGRLRRVPPVALATQQETITWNERFSALQRCCG